MPRNHGYRENPDLRRMFRRENYAQTQGAPKTGEPWTREDDKRITAPDRPTDRELAALIGRSMQAIQQRRNKIATNSNQPATRWTAERVREELHRGESA